MTKLKILNKNIAKKAQTKLGITYNQKIKGVALESMQEYADEQLKLCVVSNQRELLIDAFNWYRQTSLNVDGYPSEDLADKFMKDN